MKITFSDHFATITGQYEEWKRKALLAALQRNKLPYFVAPTDDYEIRVDISREDREAFLQLVQFETLTTLTTAEVEFE